MSARTEHSILLALLSAGRPLTAIEIATMTKASPATVYRVVGNSDKITTLPGRPARYYAARYAEMDTNKVIVVRQNPDAGWLDWTDTIKKMISQTELMTIDDKDRASRATKAQALMGIGTLFISLSAELTEGLDRPDWLERLEK